MGDAWVGFGRLFSIMGTLTFGIALVVVVGVTVLLVVLLVTVALVRNERRAWVPWLMVAAGLAAVLCLHACGTSGDEPSRRVLVVWCGDGSFREMGGVALVRKTFGRRMDRIFWALGEKDVVVREEPDPQRNAFYFEASPRGLEVLGKAIQADYRAFAESGRFRGPESYELRCFITGHGDAQRVRDGVRYVVGRPWLVGDPGLGDIRVTEDQLESFGRAIPEGVRFKCYVGVCYGHALAEALMRGAAWRTDRACAAVLAAPGMKAMTHGVVQPTDLRLIAAWGRRHTSFLRALWLSQIGQRLGGYKDGASYNLALSSSEAIVFDFFAERLGLKGLDRHAVVEARARALWDDAAAAHSLDADDAALIERRERERTAAIREILPKGCSDERAAAAPGVFQYFENCPDIVRFYPEEEKAGILLESIPSLASSLMRRHWLEDAFLRLAPDAQRENFRRLRRCELESWL